jgi:uncharacterized Zn finger protein
VADAVADTHPDRAVAIYRELAEGLIAQTKPAAYESAAGYLRKLRDLLTRIGRAAEWEGILAHLREEHRRKRTLMDVLDRLERRRIIDR